MPSKRITDILDAKAVVTLLIGGLLGALGTSSVFIVQGIARIDAAKGAQEIVNRLKAIEAVAQEREEAVKKHKDTIAALVVDIEELRRGADRDAGVIEGLAKNEADGVMKRLIADQEFVRQVAALVADPKPEIAKAIAASEGRFAKRFEAIEKGSADMSEVIRTKQLVIKDGTGRDRIALFVEEPNTRFIMFDSSRQLRAEVRAAPEGGFIEFMNGRNSSGVLQFNNEGGTNTITNK